MLASIHWSWKKVTTSVLTALGIGTLTSCYGMPVNDAVLFGQVTPAKTPTESESDDEAGITGIQVTLTDTAGSTKGQARTGEGGWYNIDVTDVPAGTYTLQFTDIDGAENGSYAPKSQTVTLGGGFGYTDASATLDEAQPE